MATSTLQIVQVKVPETFSEVKHSKIVRSETIDWDAEMHSVVIDAVVLVAFIIVFGFLKVRAHRKKAASLNGSPTKTVALKQPVDKKQPSQSSIHEILTLTADRQSGKVLEIYAKHRSAWLDVPAEELYPVFFNICLAAGRCGRIDILESVLRDMRKSNVPRTEELYTMLFKICSAQRLCKEVLALAKWMRSDHITCTNRLAWSCLCFSAAEEKEWGAALYYFKSLTAVAEPTIRDFSNAMKAHIALGDAVAAFELMVKIDEQGLEPDGVMMNMAFAACCADGKHLDLAEDLLNRMSNTSGAVDVITYNTIIKGYVQAGRLNDGFRMLQEMANAGCSCTVVTFGTLLDACISNGDMDKAGIVFQMLQESGCEMNHVLFTTLMKGFVKKGQLAKALAVYQNMLDQGIEADRVTYSTLIKAFCDNKDMKGALALFQDVCAKGHTPDEVIFNGLLNGCANCANLVLGERLFGDMVACGIQPSISSISTMIKLYAECQALPQALELLQCMEARYGTVPEQRLYVQTILAALRARKHHLALELFTTSQDLFGFLADNEANKLIKSCVGFNLLQTAVGFVEIIFEKGSQNPKFLQIIAEAAAKKKRTPMLQSVVKLAAKHGMHLELTEH